MSPIELSEFEVDPGVFSAEDVVASAGESDKDVDDRVPKPLLLLLLVVVVVVVVVVVDGVWVKRTREPLTGG